MFAEVQKLKKETERLDKLLRDNLRTSSEQSRRLERRLETLEKSNLAIKKENHIEGLNSKKYILKPKYF